MTPDELAATCIADEAANQPYEGKVAVGCVVMNRARMPYASDGTVMGAILHKWAFSGFWAQMTHGQYLALPANANGLVEAQALFTQFSKEAIWTECERAWADAQAWSYGKPMSFTPGPAFNKLTPDTVLYYNPDVSATPAWATPDTFVTTIYAHKFYSDKARA